MRGHQQQRPPSSSSSNHHNNSSNSKYDVLLQLSRSKQRGAASQNYEDNNTSRRSSRIRDRDDDDDTATPLLSHLGSEDLQRFLTSMDSDTLHVEHACRASAVASLPDWMQRDLNRLQNRASSQQQQQQVGAMMGLPPTFPTPVTEIHNDEALQRPFSSSSANDDDVGDNGIRSVSAPPYIPSAQQRRDGSGVHVLVQQHNYHTTPPHAFSSQLFIRDGSSGRPLSSSPQPQSQQRSSSHPHATRVPVPIVNGTEDAVVSLPSHSGDGGAITSIQHRREQHRHSLNTTKLSQTKREVSMSSSSAVVVVDHRRQDSQEEGRSLSSLPQKSDFSFESLSLSQQQQQHRRVSSPSTRSRESLGQIRIAQTVERAQRLREQQQQQQQQSNNNSSSIDNDQCETEKHDHDSRALRNEEEEDASEPEPQRGEQTKRDPSEAVSVPQPKKQTRSLKRVRSAQAHAAAARHGSTSPFTVHEDEHSYDPILVFQNVVTTTTTTAGGGGSVNRNVNTHNSKPCSSTTTTKTSAEDPSKGKSRVEKVKPLTDGDGPTSTSGRGAATGTGIVVIDTQPLERIRVAEEAQWPLALASTASPVDAVTALRRVMPSGQAEHCSRRDLLPLSEYPSALSDEDVVGVSRPNLQRPSSSAAAAVAITKHKRLRDDKKDGAFHDTLLEAILEGKHEPAGDGVAAVRSPVGGQSSRMSKQFAVTSSGGGDDEQQNVGGELSTVVKAVVRGNSMRMMPRPSSSSSATAAVVVPRGGAANRITPAVVDNFEDDHPVAGSVSASNTPTMQPTMLTTPSSAPLVKPFLLELPVAATASSGGAGGSLSARMMDGSQRTPRSGRLPSLSGGHSTTNTNTTVMAPSQSAIVEKLVQQHQLQQQQQQPPPSFHETTGVSSTSSDVVLPNLPIYANTRIEPLPVFHGSDAALRTRTARLWMEANRPSGSERVEELMASMLKEVKRFGVPIPDVVQKCVEDEKRERLAGDDNDVDDGGSVSLQELDPGLATYLSSLAEAEISRPPAEAVTKESGTATIQPQSHHPDAIAAVKQEHVYEELNTMSRHQDQEVEYIEAEDQAFASDASSRPILFPTDNDVSSSHQEEEEEHHPSSLIERRRQSSIMFAATAAFVDLSEAQATATIGIKEVVESEDHRLIATVTDPLTSEKSSHLQVQQQQIEDDRESTIHTTDEGSVGEQHDTRGISYPSSATMSDASGMIITSLPNNNNNNNNNNVSKPSDAAKPVRGLKEGHSQRVETQDRSRSPSSLSASLPVIHTTTATPTRLATTTRSESGPMPSSAVHVSPSTTPRAVVTPSQTSVLPKGGGADVVLPTPTMFDSAMGTTTNIDPMVDHRSAQKPAVLSDDDGTTTKKEMVTVDVHRSSQDVKKKKDVSPQTFNLTSSANRRTSVVPTLRLGTSSNKPQQQQRSSSGEDTGALRGVSPSVTPRSPHVDTRAPSTPSTLSLDYPGRATTSALAPRNSLSGGGTPVTPRLSAEESTAAGRTGGSRSPFLASVQLPSTKQQQPTTAASSASSAASLMTPPPRSIDALPRLVIDDRGDAAADDGDGAASEEARSEGEPSPITEALQSPPLDESVGAADKKKSSRKTSSASSKQRTASSKPTSKKQDATGTTPRPGSGGIPKSPRGGILPVAATASTTAAAAKKPRLNEASLLLSVPGGAGGDPNSSIGGSPSATPRSTQASPSVTPRASTTNSSAVTPRRSSVAATAAATTTDKRAKKIAKSPRAGGAVGNSHRGNKPQRISRRKAAEADEANLDAANVLDVDHMSDSEDDGNDTSSDGGGPIHTTVDLAQLTSIFTVGSSSSGKHTGATTPTSRQRAGSTASTSPRLSISGRDGDGGSPTAFAGMSPTTKAAAIERAERMRRFRHIISRLAEVLRKELRLAAITTMDKKHGGVAAMLRSLRTESPAATPKNSSGGGQDNESEWNSLASPASSTATKVSRGSAFTTLTALSNNNPTTTPRLTATTSSAPVSSSTGAAEYVTRAPPKIRVAVVISISTYLDKRISNNVQCDTEAIAMATLFSAIGFTVTRMSMQSDVEELRPTTREAVLKCIETATKSCKMGSDFASIVYVCGGGYLGQLAGASSANNPQPAVNNRSVTTAYSELGQNPSFVVVPGDVTLTTMHRNVVLTLSDLQTIPSATDGTCNWVVLDTYSISYLPPCPSQLNGFAMVGGRKTIGGDLFCIYELKHSLPLSLYLQRALSGWATRDSRLSINGINAYVHGHLSRRGIFANTTASPYFVGDLDIAVVQELRFCRQEIKDIKKVLHDKLCTFAVALVPLRNQDPTSAECVRQLRDAFIELVAMDVDNPVVQCLHRTYEPKIIVTMRGLNPAKFLNEDAFVFRHCQNAVRDLRQRLNDPAVDYRVSCFGPLLLGEVSISNGYTRDEFLQHFENSRRIRQVKDLRREWQEKVHAVKEKRRVMLVAQEEALAQIDEAKQASQQAAANAAAAMAEAEAVKSTSTSPQPLELDVGIQPPPPPPSLQAVVGGKPSATPRRDSDSSQSQSEKGSTPQTQPLPGAAAPPPPPVLPKQSSSSSSSQKHAQGSPSTPLLLAFPLKGTSSSPAPPILSARKSYEEETHVPRVVMTSNTFNISSAIEQASLQQAKPDVSRAAGYFRSPMDLAFTIDGNAVHEIGLVTTVTFLTTHYLALKFDRAFRAYGLLAQEYLVRDVRITDLDNDHLQLHLVLARIQALWRGRRCRQKMAILLPLVREEVAARRKILKEERDLIMKLNAALVWSAQRVYLEMERNARADVCDLERQAFTYMYMDRVALYQRVAYTWFVSLVKKLEVEEKIFRLEIVGRKNILWPGMLGMLFFRKAIKIHRDEDKIRNKNVEEAENKIKNVGSQFWKVERKKW